MSKIIGNTTATPNPRPDWAQTDETKADYIKNKPTILTEDDVIGSDRTAETIMDIANGKIPVYMSGQLSDHEEILHIANAKARILVSVPENEFDATNKYYVDQFMKNATISCNSKTGKLELTLTDGKGVEAKTTLDLPIARALSDVYIEDGRLILEDVSGDTIEFSAEEVLNGLITSEAYAQNLDGDAEDKAPSVKAVKTALEDVSKFNVQPDWNQTDETKADYIINKPAIQNGSGENSIQQGTNTQAITIDSSASGSGTISGSFGYRITAYDKENRIVTLYDYQNNITNELAVGDVYTIIFINNYDLHGVVEEISVSENIARVKISNVINDTLDPDVGIENITSIRNVFFVPAKPHCGYIEIGRATHTEGYETRAVGLYSHAEGCYSRAYGKYSHAEGVDTTAAYAGHAEGNETKALGLTAHAEGYLSEATGKQSHAEGYNTLASGEGAHSEGIPTGDGTRVVASGRGAHAEGIGSHAEGGGSHAEGGGTIATASFSHAEGQYSKAKGEASHAEGYYTEASAWFAHAEGDHSVATESSAHAEGQHSHANGTASHAEGYNTLAEGSSSHAEGSGSTSAGNASHAEGFNTLSIGSNSHAEGNNSRSYGPHSHAEGEGTEAGVSPDGFEGDINNYRSSHAEGIRTKAQKSASHAEGIDTLAEGIAAHSEGNKTKSVGNNAHAEGLGTIASSDSQHVQGRYNVEDASAAHIVGWGASDATRKNIHTVLTSGNAWFAGNVRIGGTSYETGKLLATEKYVNDGFVSKTELENVKAAAEGKLYRTEVIESNEVVSGVPSDALPYAMLEKLGCSMLSEPTNVVNFLNETSPGNTTNISDVQVFKITESEILLNGHLGSMMLNIPVAPIVIPNDGDIQIGIITSGQAVCQYGSPFMCQLVTQRGGYLGDTPITLGEDSTGYNALIKASDYAGEVITYFTLNIAVDDITFTDYYIHLDISTEVVTGSPVLVIGGDVSQVWTVPNKVQLMDEYGICMSADVYNYIDFQKNVLVVNCEKLPGGTISKCDPPREIDLSAYMSIDDAIIKVEGNNYLRINNEYDDAVRIPHKIKYQVRVV